MRYKIILLFAGLFILSTHFLFVLVNVGPFHAQGKLYFWSRFYVYPYFEQTWLLFTPPPNCNYKLIATYNAGSVKTKDIFNDIISRHQANRLMGYEQLLLSFVTSIHYFEKKALEKNKWDGYVTDNTDFKIIEHMTEGYLQYTHQEKISGLALILVIQDVQRKDRPRIYFNFTK